MSDTSLASPRASAVPDAAGAFERVLANLEAPTYGALFRVCMGGLIVPAWFALRGGTGSGWTLVPFFAAILLAVRVVPIGLRRVVPFSESLAAVWMERRQMAKQFDSYQWQKLFWIGWGLAAYAVVSGERFSALVLLTSFCLLSGALGLVAFRYYAGQLDSEDRGVSGG